MRKTEIGRRNHSGPVRGPFKLGLHGALSGVDLKSRVLGAQISHQDGNLFLGCGCVGDISVVVGSGSSVAGGVAIGVDR